MLFRSETPKIFFVGDSNADHYRHYMKNLNKISLYFLAEPAVMAYGKNFASMTKGYFLPIEVRQNYYKVYKETLSHLKDGDKVVLSNRWDIQFGKYCKEFDLEMNDENFNKYLEFVLQDLDEQIKLYPNLIFYIVSDAVTISKVYANQTSIDVSKSFLRYFFNKDKYLISNDTSLDKNDIVNKKLQEFVERHNNLRYIDRDIPIRLDKNEFNTVYNNMPIFQIDGVHYSTSGGDMIGKFLVEQVIKE